MQQAVKQGTFDEVVRPAEKLEVAAGDAAGFLSKDVDPVGMGKVGSSHFVHIEVLSSDARMPVFLDNPGKITVGKQYIRVHSGKSVYQKTGSGEASTFKVMSCVIVKDSGKILPADKCHPLKDAQGKIWYEISPGNWMSESDVDVLHQYDLKERGFTALKEESTADMSKSLREGWMKSLLNRLSEMVNRERGIQQQQVSDYYKKAVNNIDTDGDGELSSEELFYAVHHPEMEIRNITARMVVKHDSEWSGDSSHHKWEVYFKNYDLLRMQYAKQWRDDVEWMSQVEAFKGGASVWHNASGDVFVSVQNRRRLCKINLGDVVNRHIGAEKACQFRKKVVNICADLWGEDKKLEFANSLMACMAVETSRLFSSSVIKLMPKLNSQGGTLLNRKGKPVREYRPLSKQELNADPTIAAQSAVGLIQFTGPAVTQINKTHGLSVSKQALALMDELEQLDYVKLYFTSNKKIFDKIKSCDDVYLYIFCPIGVGQNDDFALYSRQRDESEHVNYYQANSSLDSTECGNNGNNDGVIQRSELLSRL
ncbi:Uncharacterised protein [Raoultella terrigena]|nr:Uncharacterised protein [Raoultella terrigena]